MKNKATTQKQQLENKSKQAKPIPIPIKKEEKILSSDEDDEADIRMGYKKCQQQKLPLQNAKQLQNMPSQLQATSKVDVQQQKSNNSEMQQFCQNLWESRNFDQNENEFQNILKTSQNNYKLLSQKDPAINTQTTTLKKISMLTGQAVASLPELENEFQKARESKNIPLSASILSGLISKFPDKTSASFIQYSLLYACLLLELNNFKDCIIQCELNQKLALTPLQHIQLRVTQAKCLIATNHWWESQTCLLSAQSFLCLLPEYIQVLSSSKQFDDLSVIYSSDFLQVNQEMEALQCKVNARLENQNQKINNLNIIAQTVQGQSQLKIHLELTNRRVYQVALGDSHALALVSSCHCFNRKLQLQLKMEGGQMCAGKYECQGGTLLFGWGNNSLGQILNTDIHYFDSPTIITSFLRLNVKGILANKSSSMAFDKKGTIYQWGGFEEKQEQKQNSIVTFHTNQTIKKLIHGQSYIGFLTSKGEVIIKGEMMQQGNNDQSPNVISYNEFTKVSQNNHIIQAAGGENHILMLNNEGVVFGIGDNSQGQLSLGINIKQTEKVCRVAPFKNIIRIGASHNCSFILNEEGDVSFCGDIGNNQQRIFQFRQAVFHPQTPILNCSVNNKIMAVGRNGKAYIWEPSQEYLFQEKSLPQQKLFASNLRNVYAGKLFQIYETAIIKPKCCIINNEQTQFISFEKSEIEIQLCDKYGLCLQAPSAIYEYHVFLEESKEGSIAQKLEELIAMSYNLSQNQMSQLQHQVSVCKLGQKGQGANDIMNDLMISQQHVLSLTVVKNGSYRLHVLLNNTPLKNSPLEIGFQESKKEIQIASQEEQQMLMKEMMEKKQVLEQQAKIKAEDMKKQKQIDTDLRAKEAHDQYLEQQKVIKSQQQYDRQMKKDSIVGGGFNLDYVGQKKIMAQEQSLSQKQEPRDNNQLNKGKSKTVTASNTKNLQQKQQK